MDTVKHGVIGLGFFGEKHCEALADIPNVELYALCTRTESRLENLAEKFGVDHAYTDYNEMLENPDLEAVSITTMWDQHVEPAVAAIEAGKHVFCEKPMASTVDECRRIVDAADASDHYFMVGHICRFNPRYATAKREIDAGKVGDIVSMYARRNIPADVSAEVLPKIGPIVGDGVHDMDLLLWYSGAKPVSVYAKYVDVRGLPNPDIGWSMFTMDTGAVAVLENVWFLTGRSAVRIDERMEIVGTDGTIRIQEVAPNLSIAGPDEAIYPDTTYWPELHGVRAGALRDELRYFADCILQGIEPTIITPHESMAAVVACLAARESAESGEVVQL